MTSRPALLLQKQLYQLERLIERQEILAGNLDLLWGIDVSLVYGSIFHWRVSLNGLHGSPWQGGIFLVDIIFDENYDSQPPQVSFVTVPFHPNIDMNTGCPCMDALINWNPKTSIIELMVELQILLCEPVIEGCVNEPAGDIFRNAPRLFNQMIQDSIVASRRVEAGLDPFESSIEDGDDENELNVDGNNSREKKAIKHLSFDDYYAQWRDLASSVDSKSSTQLSAFSKEQKQLLENNKHLLYGKFKSGHSKDVNTKKKSHFEHLKKLYQKPQEEKIISWELEAQELLEWTRSLAAE